MQILKTRYYIKELFSFALIFSFFIAIIPEATLAQTENNSSVSKKSEEDISHQIFDVEKDFRVETLPLSNGAELITIFAKFKGLTALPVNKDEEVPVFSVLRDTLGDDKVENDRLRYFWILNYTKPSLTQKISAGIPFLYRRTTNKGSVGKGAPPPIMDLNPSKRALWDRVFWIVFRNWVLEDLGMPIKLATLQYQQSKRNYRSSAIVRALAVMALYENIEGKKVLTAREIEDIQAKMFISEQPLGSFLQKENLQRVYETRIEQRRDVRGHNWELLRQYSEAEDLYFEPLEMADGDSTHALIWVSLSDLPANKDKKFNSRFLNIKNPWNDPRLENWKGYSEVRWFNQEGQLVEPETPDSSPKTMVPLALYGLDFPKIPTLLVDFRDRSNPKRREMSRRVLDDVARNVLSISRFNNLPYFFGRYVYNFATSRRGMDINQGTRLGSYSQLKLLLALNASLDPKLRDEISDRLESVSLNPLENNLEVEVKVANQQYKNLIEYAKDPKGLPAKIEKDRMDEMVKLKHGSGKRILYSMGRVFSLGIYKHTEKDTKELSVQMDLRRQLEYHERYLIEVAQVSSKPEVDSDVEAIKKSLNFISEYGNDARGKTARTIAKLFSITEDEELRSLCLSSLFRINNSTAKKELLAIYNNQKFDKQWRDKSADYLILALKEDQRISPTDAKTIAKITED